MGRLGWRGPGGGEDEVPHYLARNFFVSPSLPFQMVVFENSYSRGELIYNYFVSTPKF